MFKALTAKQVKHLEEINIDKKAVEDTLKVAMEYHSNRKNELLKLEREWWDEMALVHDLDSEIKYVTAIVEGVAGIKEKEEVRNEPN